MPMTSIFLPWASMCGKCFTQQIQIQPAWTGSVDRCQYRASEYIWEWSCSRLLPDLPLHSHSKWAQVSKSVENHAWHTLRGSWDTPQEIWSRWVLMWLIWNENISRSRREEPEQCSPSSSSVQGPWRSNDRQKHTWDLSKQMLGLPTNLITHNC